MSSKQKLNLRKNEEAMGSSHLSLRTEVRCVSPWAVNKDTISTPGAGCLVTKEDIQTGNDMMPPYPPPRTGIVTVLLESPSFCHQPESGAFPHETLSHVPSTRKTGGHTGLKQSCILPGGLLCGQGAMPGLIRCHKSRVRCFPLTAEQLAPQGVQHWASPANVTC